MSITYEAFFVDEARLRAVYGCRDEALIADVQSTSYWQFLVELGAAELARNLEYAKKVAPRAYEPLQRVDLDPAAALLDVVLGRELRPMGVEFYDNVLWCVCDAIGENLLVENPGSIWEIEKLCEIAAETHTLHPYLPVPVVRRATVTDFAVYSPATCKRLLGELEKRRDEIEEQVGDVEEWIDALQARDASASMLVFGA